MTRRCTARERIALKRMCIGWWGGVVLPEPALGTLDERLGILVRRYGGRTKLGPIDKTSVEACRVKEGDDG